MMDNIQYSEQEWLDAARNGLLKGDAASAESLLSRGLAQYPRSFELRRILAVVYRQTGRLEQAVELLEHLFRERPEDFPTAFTLAQANVEQARPQAASIVLRNCFEQARQDAEMAIQAIELLDEADRKRDAACIADVALASAPDDARLHAYDGMLQLQLGVFDQARVHYTHALEHSPQACDWHAPHGLASAQRYVDATHPDFALFKRLLRREDLSEKARASLLFALGKAHDDVADYPVAASYFRHANQLAHSQTKWSRKLWRRGIEARLASPRIAPTSESRRDFIPVFIVGMPRSGTTLLAELLSRFPLVCNRGESPWLPRLASQPDLSANPDHVSLEKAAAVYVAQMLRDDSCGARWFIDKQPLNFRYVDLALGMFPDARVLWCRRNPRDTALSLWMQSFIEDVQGYAYDFADIEIVMKDCEKLMAHWRAIHPDAILPVDYEEIVRDPSHAADEIAAWLQLMPRSESTPENVRDSISTASVWQARQPVFTRSVKRWRGYADVVPELLGFDE